VIASGAPVTLYDTTLRDGAQTEGVAFSVEDKRRILLALDALGLGFVEMGWPGANPKDDALFAMVRGLLAEGALHGAVPVAFGSTRHAANPPDADPVLAGLLGAGTPAITLFGKTWDLHVREALRIEPQANLDLIADSLAYLKTRVDTLFFDAEHFFDGFKDDPDYALACLKAAAEGGAEALVLCDTNGGALPEQIQAGVAAALKLGLPVGIHAHNDGALAVANTLAAVGAGARHIQGTINGLGERCGNANLCSVIPNLMLKRGFDTLLPAGKLAELRPVSLLVSELANQPPNRHAPFVGDSAFAHKAGVHVSAIQRNPETYEHIDPTLVGNRRRVLVSEQSGRSNILYKIQGLEGVHLNPDDPRIRTILDRIKELEHLGYQFEGAEGSFELLVRGLLGSRPRYFELHGFRVIDEKRSLDEIPLAEATVRLSVAGEEEHTAALGNGPVNALDRALRRALIGFYPTLADMTLLDFKVRVIEGSGTDAGVRVLVESGDGARRWGTVGVSQNVIEASWQALVDAIEFKLMKDGVAGV